MAETKKKVYFIQPTYRNAGGTLFKGRRLAYSSLALPALSALVPRDWEKQFCFEYFDDVEYATDASLIGISSMGYDLPHGMEIADEFRRRGKRVIFGGPQAQCSSELLRPHCDSIVYGNPSAADIEKILGESLNGTLQPVYKCGMDANYPFDYSVLKGKSLQFYPILLGVGCVNTCSYCSTASLHGGAYRMRNLKYVLKELEEASRQTRNVVFVDANILNSGQYVERLCSRIIAAQIRLRWGAQCTIDVGDDTSLLRLMRKAGCRILLIGIETLNQRNMNRYGKNYGVSLHRKRIEAVRNAGIEIGGYFMLGLDEDTPECFDDIFAFIRETGIALPILNILVPAPGTRTHEQIKREGRLLVTSEYEYLRNNAHFTTSAHCCFYRPKRMTVEETEQGYLRLYRRLSTWREIARRSVRMNPVMASMLFSINAQMREEYRGMLSRRNDGIVVEKDRVGNE